MPLRTIKDAFFMFAAPDGHRVWAQRAETHDIPEGPDLDRGDALGAFTADGSEPGAPEGSYIPDPEIAWEPQEWEAWVDAGKINEIVQKVNAVAPELRGQVAGAVIEAEHGRRDKARPELLQAMAQIADGVPTPVAPQAVVDTSSEADISLLSDDALARWISINSTEAILAAVGSNAALADEIRLAEQSGKARPELLQRLTEFVGGAVRGEFAATDLPASTGGLGKSDTQSTDGDGDLAQFVAESNVPAILEKVGTDADVAREVEAIENARPTPRKTLLDALAQIGQ